MLSRTITMIVLPTLLTASSARKSDCGTKLGGLEGWTILKTKTIKGTFKGCKYDDVIEFSDGTALRCSSYGYQYAYYPDAIILGKSTSLGGRSLIALKLMVEEEVYDVTSVSGNP